MHLSSTRKGEIYVLICAAAWSLFPVISTLFYASLPPIYSAAINSFASALFFAGILSCKRKWKEGQMKKAWKPIFFVTITNGTLYYLLYFIALKETNPGNVALLAQTEALFAFLILSLIWKHEPLDRTHLLGCVFMLIGACIVLAPRLAAWHLYDLLIVLAASIVPIGNYWQQKAMKYVAPETILFWRGLLATLPLVLIAMLFESLPQKIDWQRLIPLLFINGFFVLGIAKLCWLEAIHRIPITKGNSIASIVPFFTLGYAWLILDQTATIWQIASSIPIVIGIRLLTLPTAKNNE